MMKKKIQIPNVTRDARIGSVFNVVFDIIKQTESATAAEIVWSFDGCSFFHPFFIAPLAIYKQECGKRIEVGGMEPFLERYFKLIHFATPLSLPTENAGEALTGYAQRSYVPLCRFKVCPDGINAVQSAVQRILVRQLPKNYNVKNPLSYLLSELIDNIEQHSRSPFGYIFSQYLQRERCLLLCIADAGDTVYGSFIHAKRFMAEIGTNEAEALRLATNGRSTKNLPDAENRGFGIPSSKRMLVEGIGGSFFMLSGCAFHRHDAKDCNYVSLPDILRWNGTILLLRIPIEAPAGFDYTQYF